MIWVIWIVASIIFLGGYEWYAIKYGKTTLSRMVYNGTKNFPLLSVIIGYFIGGLTWALFVHFFWHWCPNLVTRGF